MKTIFSLLFAFVLVTGCQKDTSNSGTPPAEEKTVLNVPYGTDAQQQMDIYLPAGRTTADTKVLVLIHGGAWSSGDKADFADYLSEFKDRLPGYAIFNINYRLAAFPATNVFPAQELDVKAAVDSVVSKAGEYLVNKDKLVLLGASAGAHLALLQAYKQPSPEVKAVVDMFGPADMVDLYNSFSAQEKLLFEVLLSGTPATNPALYQSASPVKFVSAASPPTLILHGDADPLVPVAESQALHDSLQQAGVPVQLKIYAGEGHGWSGANLLDSYQRIEDFLKQYNP